ncbi:hypothetical protein U8607_09115 [Methylobacterium durans]|uniref:TadE/TadG family type IV pilus assembly protein n=1 Tax=Methylobacterium durans TaxID=2202825 RepID=UPI002AFFADEA|nr:hypothetical protein [Methylobacterium durans]MEA1832242.1 hypothetical protein [Methylobacterium durans]
MGRPRTRLRRPVLLPAREGSAIVEFALVATTLIYLVAGVIDLVAMSGINREIERASTQLAAAIASCPTGGSTSCVTDTMDLYRTRKANVLMRYPAATLSMAQINEVSGAIKVCAGNLTYLDADVQTSALSLLYDRDVGIVVMIQMDYQTIFPSVTRLFTGASLPHLRGWSVAVQMSDKQIC